MSIVLFGLGLVGGALLWFGAGWRSRQLAPPPAPGELRRAAELEHGVFRVQGRVVPVQTTPSPLDGAACVFIEHADYETVGSDAIPMRRQVAHGIVAHPFYVEDESGVVFVDPADAHIDTVVLLEDGGLTAERRLRRDEEVVVSGAFTAETIEMDGGPYRSAGQTWVARASGVQPLQISYRTDPSMMRPSDSLTLFLRGAATLTFGIFSFLGLFSFLVSH